MKENFKTIIEPFKIKMVEPIRMTTRKEREHILRLGYYNLFLIKAEDILIDLLTDSGTSAMSSLQWAEMMKGDESYAGCQSFYQFEKTVQEITGLKYIFPTHQGRAAERILFSVIQRPKAVILNNTHFDTTRANIEALGMQAIDLVIDLGMIPSAQHPFKGNMDTKKLEAAIKAYGAKNIPLVMLTVTNNSGGGQPVSLGNIRQVARICKKNKLPLFLDACRFAENAYFIQQREPGYKNYSVKQIAQEMFSYVDGCTMSAKKDALVNMGGWLAVNDLSLSEKIKNMEILTEGFPTYGGLAGRDLAAISQGLQEVLDEDYLHYRIASAQYLGNKLNHMGVPIVRPIGGHAVYIDAKSYLPHIPALKLPAQSLALELYLCGGVRSVEIGSLMFGKGKKSAPMELVRLALPRRVYTQSHIDYVIEVMEKIHQVKDRLPGYQITHQPPFLRHFSAKLKPFKS